MSSTICLPIIGSLDSGHQTYPDVERQAIEEMNVGGFRVECSSESLRFFRSVVRVARRHEADHWGISANLWGLFKLDRVWRTYKMTCRIEVLPLPAMYSTDTDSISCVPVPPE